jgi:hypothetical protein
MWPFTVTASQRTATIWLPRLATGTIGSRTVAIWMAAAATFCLVVALQ